MTKSTTCFAVRSILRGEIPNDDGFFRPIGIVAETGSILDAGLPTASAGGAGRDRGGLSLLRDPAAIARDLRDGRIDAAFARRHYRLVIDRRSVADIAATARKRGAALGHPTKPRSRTSNRQRRTKS